MERRQGEARLTCYPCYRSSVAGAGRIWTSTCPRDPRGPPIREVPEAFWLLPPQVGASLSTESSAHDYVNGSSRTHRTTFRVDPDTSGRISRTTSKDRGSSRGTLSSTPASHTWTRLRRSFLQDVPRNCLKEGTETPAGRSFWRCIAARLRDTASVEIAKQCPLHSGSKDKCKASSMKAQDFKSEFNAARNARACQKWRRLRASRRLS